jgi:type I restriction enzyme S subunit
MKTGYKQTEVGVIPEDWDAAPFGTLASIDRGKFSARPRNDPRFYGGDIPFIQTGDVTRSGGKITTFTQTLNRDGLRVSRLFPNGTLFFTIAANIGDVGITTFEAACPDSLVAVSPNPSIDKHWLLYELARRKADFESLASPGAQLNINLEKLRPYLMPVPPLPEQRAIAAALSDVDGLLGALDRLIAKKRDLKQAAMQQLLTGQTRLPGFKGEWVVKTFGNLLRFQVGFPFSSAYFNEKGEGIRLVKNRDLKNNDQIFHYSGKYEQSFVVRNGDVLVGMDGDFLPCKWSKGPALLNQRVGRIVPSSGLNGAFAYYALIGPLKEIETVTSSTTVKHLSHGDVEGIERPLPDLPEQTAIASVLSEMDAELAALEQRRDKTRALKQGMMQELLTGRTRLL